MYWIGLWSFKIAIFQSQASKSLAISTSFISDFKQVSACKEMSYVKITVMEKIFVDFFACWHNFCSPKVKGDLEY